MPLILGICAVENKINVNQPNQENQRPIPPNQPNQPNQRSIPHVLV